MLKDRSGSLGGDHHLQEACTLKTELLIFVVLACTPGQSQSQKPSGNATSSLKARAESGDVRAQVDIGMAYASGDGIELDESAAVKWFRRAAESGYPAGEYSLGEMYLTGRGVAQNASEAAVWIRRAAEGGEPRGQFNLAVMYAQGTGLAKNESEAASWMRKAADQGFATAEFGLGSMYAHGAGVLENAEEAAKWYRKAAAQGELAATNNLAFLLATSSDPKVRNPREAVAIAQGTLAVNADNATLWDTLATALFESNDSGKAAEAERHALTLRPGDASYKKSLGKYLAAAR